MSEAAAAPQTVRAFIRANATIPGALEALDALNAMEADLLAASGTAQRETAYSTAIVDAQREIQPAYKDKFIPRGSGGAGMKVAETAQILDLSREVMAQHGLALEVGNLEVVMIGAAAFLRVTYGLRHREGFVRSVSRDFPLGHGATNPDTVRGANTSALGYFLIDAFALPRRQADSLEAEAERASAKGAARSGPRRAGASLSVGSGSASSAPRSADGSGSPPAAAKKPPTIADFVARARAAADAEALEAAYEWTADQRFAIANGEGKFTEAEIKLVADAIAARRAELGA